MATSGLDKSMKEEGELSDDGEIVEEVTVSSQKVQSKIAKKPETKPKPNSSSSNSTRNKPGTSSAGGSSSKNKRPRRRTRGNRSNSVARSISRSLAKLRSIKNDTIRPANLIDLTKEEKDSRLRHQENNDSRLRHHEDKDSRFRHHAGGSTSGLGEGRSGFWQKHGKYRNAITSPQNNVTRYEYSHTQNKRPIQAPSQGLWSILPKRPLRPIPPDTSHDPSGVRLQPIPYNSIESNPYRTQPNFHPYNMYPGFLNAIPPPPPPPPPPPLPIAPPPEIPPPPPLLLPNQPKKPAKKKARKPKYWDIDCPRSPPSNINEDDYIDLLLEYKQIQRQLEDIKQEEEKASGILTGDGTKLPSSLTQAEPAVQAQGANKENQDTEPGLHESGQDTGSQGEPIQSGGVNKENQENESQLLGSALTVDDKLLHLISQERLPQSGQDTGSQEEEDLDELELRLAALASAARANRKALEDDKPVQRSTSASPHSSSPSQRSKRGAPSRKRTRHGSPRESAESNRRRNREKELQDELDRQEQRRRETQRILLMDDPKEQVESFLQLVRNSPAVGHDGRRGSSKSPQTKRQVSRSPSVSKMTLTEKGLELSDNYEEVEMDMDSNPGSPGQSPDTIIQAIEVPADPVDQAEHAEISIPGQSFGWAPEEYDPVQPAMDFLQNPPPPGVDLLEHFQQFAAQYWHEKRVLPSEDALPSGGQVEQQHLTVPGVGDTTASTATASPRSEPALHESSEVVFHKVESPVPTAVSNDDEVEGDEADALRAQLLSSLAKKKQDQLEERSSRSASPAPLPNTAPQRRAPRPVVQIPQHQPVVIKLGEDSSDESESESAKPSQPSTGGLLGNLDQFLKEARRAVEASTKVKPTPQSGSKAESLNRPQLQPTAPYIGKKLVVTTSGSKRQVKEKSVQQTELERKVSELEDKMGKERSSLNAEEKTLDSVRMKVARRKSNLRVAELKVQKLKEQLAAAERIVKFNMQDINKLSQQAQLVQARVDVKKDAIVKLEDEAKEAGRKTFGESFKPGVKASSSAKQLPRRNIQVSEPGRSNVGVMAPPGGTKPAVSRATRLTPQERAKEKARLQELEKKYAEKIRLLKQAQAKKMAKENSNIDRYFRSVTGLKTFEPPPEPDKIVTEERMSFNFGPDVDKEVADVRPTRRRSLVDMSPSMKPNLPLRDVDLFSNISFAISHTESISNKALSDSDVMDSDVFESASQAAERVSANRRRSHSVPPDGTAESKKAEAEPPEVKLPPGPVLEKLCKIYRISIKRLPPLWCKEIPLHLQASSSQSLFSRNPSTSLNSMKLDSCPVEKLDPWPRNGGLKAYSSPMLAFRAYRFSPYFRIKEKHSLTSSSFGHKILPAKVFCRFALMGTCHDDKCPWQHAEDYTLSKEEQLQDLASYSDNLCKLNKKMPVTQAQKQISQFVNTFQQQSNKMTHEEQCLFLVSRVNEAEKRAFPHMMALEARPWKLTQKDNSADSADIGEVDRLDRLPAQEKEWKSNWARGASDDVLFETDVRYWMLGDQEVQDMESAVIDAPNDLQMWLKLAYKKLHDSPGPISSRLDQALNVLARSLEANRHSSELWQHYLNLYSHQGAQGDILAQCQQAVHYAPSYELFIKYLSLVPTYQQKDSLCVRVVEWLQGQRNVCVRMLSQQLLEIILYRAHLSLLTGRVSVAKQVLETALMPLSGGGSFIGQFLTAEDLSVAWLCRIHLIHRELPASIFDPVLSRLVSKEPLLVPWRVKGQLVRTGADMEELWEKAIYSIISAKRPDQDEGSVSVHLVKNWVHFLAAKERFAEAEDICWRHVQLWPWLEDLWALLAWVDVQSGAVEKARQVLREGIVNNPCSSYLNYTLAKLELTQGRSDSALEVLEDLSLSLYEVDTSDSCHADPNLLYCLLLELQGEWNAAVEAHEMALTSLTDTADISTIWMSYLELMYQNVIKKKMTAPGLVDLVMRCLTSSPVRFPLPCQPAQNFLKYDFHNCVVAFLMACLPEAQRTSALERLLKTMPANRNLIFRACNDAVDQGNWVLAKGISTASLLDHPTSIDLWKTHLAVASRDAGYRQMRNLYRRATRKVPLNHYIWKHYILFELAYGHKDTVRQLIQKCQEIGVETKDFMKIPMAMAQSVGKNVKS